jgi:hypothetical protein
MLRVFRAVRDVGFDLTDAPQLCVDAIEKADSISVRVQQYIYLLLTSWFWSIAGSPKKGRD